MSPTSSLEKQLYTGVFLLFSQMRINEKGLSAQLHLLNIEKLFYSDIKQTLCVNTPHGVNENYSETELDIDER